jgi:hypothetical protein
MRRCRIIKQKRSSTAYGGFDIIYEILKVAQEV